MPTSHDEQVRRLAHEANEALLGFAPAFEPMKAISSAPNHRRALKLLSTACLGSSQSVLYLVRGLRLWDAEIVIRSVFEGTMKFVYLLENPTTFAERCTEYSEVLPTISKLRWHIKSAEALSALGDEGDISRQPFRDILLPEEEIQAIRDKYSRETRQKIEARWGFTELVAAMSRPGGALGSVGRSTLHSYMVSSHLAHMTHEGIDMPVERDMREQERRAAVTLGHAARVISDCLELTMLRATSVWRFIGRPPDDLLEMRARNERLFGELNKASDQFSEIEYGSRRTRGG
jgi:hypothetical protein